MTNLPLCAGGTNDKDNLQLLCKKCHSNKTQEEAANRGLPFHPLESQLSPHLWQYFHKVPKPLPRSGSWTQTGPGPIACLDVRGCRSNALFEYV